MGQQLYVWAIAPLAKISLPAIKLRFPDARKIATTQISSKSATRLIGGAFPMRLDTFVSHEFKHLLSSRFTRDKTLK